MPIYMNYDGIPGDVTSSGHEQWIELLSFQFGVNRSMTDASGKGVNREAGTPSVSEIVATKKTDGASSNLFQAALGKGPGAEGQTIKINFVKVDSSQPEPYLQLELTNALVSSFSQSSGGDRPMESLSLNFTKITYNNISMGAANDTGNPERFEYDLAAHK